MPKERFPPILLNLQNVIPIAQTQQHGDIVVTALAFEVYEDGSIVTFLINSTPGARYTSERFGRAAFTIELRDMTGQLLTYSHARIDDGIGDAYGFRGRVTCGLYWVNPRLEGQQVQLVIPEMRWTHAELLPDAIYDQPIADETITGPWVFIFALKP